MADAARTLVRRQEIDTKDLHLSGLLRGAVPRLRGSDNDGAHFAATIDRTRFQTVLEGEDLDDVLDDWDDIEPTLAIGDVVLLMGASSMSWKICNSQFAHSFFKPQAIRYSHVAVVVAPMIPDVKCSKTDKVVTPGRGALILEVMDNTDSNISDVNGNVKYHCPQVVEARKRIFGLDTEAGTHCYTRVGVRKLILAETGGVRKSTRVVVPMHSNGGREISLPTSIVRFTPGLEATPELLARIDAFIKAHENYEMELSPSVMLAYVHPWLHQAWNSRGDKKMTMCSELISDFYKDIGVMISSKSSLRSSLVGNSSAAAEASETAEFLQQLKKDAVPLKKLLSSADDEDVEAGAEAVSEKLVAEKPSLAIGPYEFGEGLEHRLNLHPKYTLSPEFRMPTLQAGRGRIIDE